MAESYDLSPHNDHLLGLGLGFFHSGVEVDGVEYSFGDQGGIFTQPPRQTPNAPLRETVDMGESQLNADEVRRLVDAMRPEYPGTSYHLIKKNCNVFTTDLCSQIVPVPVPGYVNRLANIGACFSCLIPDSVLQAPVSEGDGGRGTDYATAGAGSYRDSRQGASASGAPAGGVQRFLPFGGQGMALSGRGTGDAGGRYARVSTSDGDDASPVPDVGSMPTASDSQDARRGRREAALRAALRRQQRTGEE